MCLMEVDEYLCFVDYVLWGLIDECGFIDFDIDWWGSCFNVY